MYKGYPNTNKEDRSICEYVTVSPIAVDKYGLDIAAQKGVTFVASDTAELGTTSTVIVASGHVANIGDLIRFNSGPASGYEAIVVNKTNNNIELGQTLPFVPAVGDSFNIYRSITQTLTATGTMPATLSFTRDGVAQEIIEDTVNPANNRPLPVRLMDFNGEMTLNAANLDLNVQLSDQGANADVVRIGNGVNQVDINSSKEMLVKDTTSNGLLSAIDADTTALAGCVAGSELQVDVVSSALPTGAATEATLAGIKTDADSLASCVSSSKLQVDVVTSALPTGAATEATLSGIKTDADALAGCVGGTELQVDIVGALPAGNNNIGDVDVVSCALPTGAATEATLSAIKTDADSLAGCVSSSKLQVDIASALPAGNNNIGDVDVVSCALPTGAATEATLSGIKTDTTALAGCISFSKVQVDVASALPAGNNNIGDVDIASLPNINLNYLDIKNTAYLDFSTTNLPGSASDPAQLIASLSADIKKIQVFDTGGNFMEIMTGGVGSEVRKVLVGPGSNETVECAISSGTRVSVRRIDSTSAATEGGICVNFLG